MHKEYKAPPGARARALTHTLYASAKENCLCVRVFYNKLTVGLTVTRAPCIRALSRARALSQWDCILCIHQESTTVCVRE